MDVYLNGKMIPRNQAAIPATDAGFQHAVGLFETMAACNGKPFRLAQHLNRLAESAQILGLARDIDTKALADAVNVALAHNQLTEARIRLTLSPGPISLLRPAVASEVNADAATATPIMTTLVVADPPTEYAPAYFDKGITTVVIPNAANPFDPTAGHKTLAYWSRLRTLRLAASAGAGEAIWLSVSNHLASGAISNIFLVRDRTLLTPIARGEEVAGALPAPVLPGITRTAVLELAVEQNLSVERQMLTIEDLLDADEVFLTNSSWQILPVTQVEKKPIADGNVGPVTTQLRGALLDLIKKETT